jgi:tRNA (uracil-5-)-methyltransferase
MAHKKDSASYASQLEEKVQRLSAMLKPFDAPELAVFDSEPEYYRMRAEFRVWHDGDDLYHIMFDQETKSKYRVDQFPAASKTINLAMEKLMEKLRNRPSLRKKLFQIDYLTGLSGELVISLLYHRQLDDEWEADIQQLKRELQPELNVNFIGRARKQKRIVNQDFIIESLPIQGRDYLFKHIENSFTQPNAKVNIKMIEWAKQIASNCKGDLLELYCGAGNFSLPLAEDFNSVIGTEIAKPSVHAAQYNITANNIDNVKIVRLSAEEFVEALNQKRTFSRLEGIQLQDYQFDTVLVDPPRAGLDEKTVECVQQFKNIIYISCNPETLVDNLQTLCETHKVAYSALFDQFPFTHHMETGVLLTRKS